MQKELFKNPSKNSVAISEKSSGRVINIVCPINMAKS